MNTATPPRMPSTWRHFTPLTTHRQRMRGHAERPLTWENTVGRRDHDTSDEEGSPPLRSTAGAAAGQRPVVPSGASATSPAVVGGAGRSSGGTGTGSGRNGVWPSDSSSRSTEKDDSSGPTVIRSTASGRLVAGWK